METKPPTDKAPAPAADKPLNERVVDLLKTVYDPEIPVNIYELGMVYQVDATPEGSVYVKMTLTTPACPVAGTLPGEVEKKIKGLPGVNAVKLELVWEPAWNPQMMSEAAKLRLGFM